MTMERFSHFKPQVYLVWTLMTVHVTADLIPPLITRQPLESILYFHATNNVSDTSTSGNAPFQLDCEATGNPPPTISWSKNGEPFDWTDHSSRISLARNRGTLMFFGPIQTDEGYYQCRATNTLGAAVSKQVLVKHASLDDFPPDDKPFILVVSELDTLSLPCHNSPKGDPKPIVSWVIESTNTDQTRALDTQRHLVDPDGKLHFASVSYDDALTDEFYTCNVSNVAGTRLGSRIKLTVLPPDPAYGNRTSRPLTELYLSPESVTVLFGTPLQIHCIYGGTPLPEVTWRKKQGPLRYLGSYEFADRGQVLRIPSVTWRDEGVYECNVTNSYGVKQTHTFRVRVVLPPKFLTLRTGNMNVTTGNNVIITCPVYGIPQPEVKWLMNGEPLENLPPSPHRSEINNTALQIDNVSIKDSGSYQCNASNPYGYDLQNIYLNVTDPSSPPKLVAIPSFEIVEGQSIYLGCGQEDLDDDERVVWEKDSGVVVGANGDYRPTYLQNGTLLLRNATKEDQGFYRCIITKSSKSGPPVEREVLAGTVVVREMTKITVEPESQSVTAGSNVTFICNVTGDESLNITTEWRYNDLKLNPKFDEHVIIDENNTLHLPEVTSRHTGNYVCVAASPLDRVSVSAFLFVKDVPPSPDVIGLKCNQHLAHIEWRLFDDVRIPLLGYTLQYSSNIDDLWHDVENISAIETSYDVSLTPGLRFRFRVIAINEVGASKPSEPSVTCEAEASVPAKNPPNVTVKSGKIPEEVIVYWSPIPPEDQNGPDFHYEIHWQLERKENPTSGVVTVWEWDATNVTLHIPGATLEEVRVRVSSHNRVGVAKPEPSEVVALIGEDVPLEAPQNLTVLRVLNATTAVVYWSPVPPKTVRGIIRGYKLETWTTPDEDRSRRVVEVLGNHTVVILKVLRPSHKNNLRVRVFNGAHDGPSSETLTFSTL